MKRLYILISFLCLIGAATAQNSNQNYVVTRTMLNESSSSYLDVVKYYDGLGRLCQTVHNQVTPQKNNLLDLSEYDESGRDVKDWLPVYSSSAYLSASAFPRLLLVIMAQRPVLSISRCTRLFRPIGLWRNMARERSGVTNR